MDTDAEERIRQQAATIESLRAQVERLQKELDEARPRVRSTIPERRFGIADSLILVAALACGMAVTARIFRGVSLREIWDSFTTPPSPEGWKLGLIIVMFAGSSTFLIIPCFVAWTVACVLLRLRGPRSPRFLLQPGAMACLLATVMIFLAAAIGLGAWAMTGPESGRLAERAFWIIILGGVLIGLGILCCWVTTALYGRWRPEPTWIDRMGRLTGVGWIVAAMIYGYTAIAFWPF